MKKRLRKTGEIVDVLSFSNFYRSERDDSDEVSYIDSKGVEHHHVRGLNLWWDFEDIPIEDTHIPNFDCEHLRYEIAKTCINGILGNDEMVDLANDAGRKRNCRDIPTNVAEMAVAFADALINELKKGGKSERDTDKVR